MQIEHAELTGIGSVPVQIEQPELSGIGSVPVQIEQAELPPPPGEGWGGGPNLGSPRRGVGGDAGPAKPVRCRPKADGADSDWARRRLEPPTIGASVRGLERTLGLTQVVAISTGAMLGSGIFVLPGLAFAKTGDSVWLAYLFAGLCVLPAAYSKAEMATAFPRSGGSYVFLDLGFGPMAGAVAGIGLWVALLLKSAFALVGFGAYLQVVWDVPLQPTALVFLAVIVVMNLLGVRKVGKSLMIVVGFALLGLGSLVVAGLTAPARVESTPFFGQGTMGFLAAAAFVFVSYDGVTKVAAIAEEVKDPERNLPLGILLSLGLVTLLYTTVVMALVELLPANSFVGDLRPIHSAAAGLWGHGVGVAFAVLGVLTMASMANAGLLASSRFPFAMARDRLLPDVVALLHARYLTPVVSILCTGVAMALAIVYLDVEAMAKLASAFKILIFTAVNVALIVFRESRAQWYKPAYRSPLYPTIQVFGIVAGLVLLGTMGGAPIAAILGVALPGALLYLLYGRRRTGRTGVLGRLGPRQELITGEYGSNPEATATLPSEAAAVVLLFGKERSPEVLAEVGTSLADGRTVEVLHLTEVPEQTPAEAVRDTDPEERALRRRLRAMAQEKQVDLQVATVISRDIVASAHEVSERLHCDWIVLEWTGRSAQRFLFLTPLGWLVNHLSCNLALYKDAGVRYIRHIVAYAQPGPDDALVVSTADHLAAFEGAELTFIRFVHDDAPETEVQTQADYVDQLRDLCDVPTHSHIVRGTDRVTAIAEATAAYDLLVTSAPPAGTLAASPAARISEEQRRISSCNRPTALCSASSERNELEHTSSARPPVTCASVPRSGRISWSTAGTPSRAICQAASEPPSPPPITWMGGGVAIFILVK